MAEQLENLITVRIVNMTEEQLLGEVTRLRAERNIPKPISKAKKAAKKKTALGIAKKMSNEEKQKLIAKLSQDLGLDNVN